MRPNSNCFYLLSPGKYSHDGCTLKFVLDWAWDRVTSTKQSVDKVTLPLFDLSGAELSEGAKRGLMQSSQQLSHLR